MLDKLLVFDIETVPDVSAVKPLTGSTTEDVLTLRKELEDYHLEVANNPFPRQPFHEVVSISMLVADIVRHDGYEYYKINKIGTLSRIDNTEEKLVKKFFDYICKKTPRLVDYNGKTFDLPVLKYRAMKYNISLEEMFKSGVDKWNSYSYRYSMDWHCDLLEAFSDYGASARCKMNEVCSILGLPGKIGVDGSKVTDLFDAGKLKEIDDYCETDVLNTYLLYLNYAHLTGTIDDNSFFDMNRDLVAYLEEANKEHFFEFLAAWEESDNKGIF